MELLRDILAWPLILTGCFFTVVSALGLVRLPDVYTRIHSAGLVDTVGAGFVLAGLTLYGGVTIVSVKLLLILAFIFFTSPTANNAFAYTVHSAGIKPRLAAESGEKKEDAPSST